jgi:hypothetical protein
MIVGDKMKVKEEMDKNGKLQQDIVTGILFRIFCLEPPTKYK